MKATTEEEEVKPMAFAHWWCYLKNKKKPKKIKITTKFTIAATRPGSYRCKKETPYRLRRNAAGAAQSPTPGDQVTQHLPAIPQQPETTGTGGPCSHHQSRWFHPDSWFLSRNKILSMIPAHEICGVPTGQGAPEPQIDGDVRSYHPDPMTFSKCSVFGCNFHHAAALTDDDIFQCNFNSVKR